MIQLALFPRKAEELLADLRRERLATGQGGRRGGRYPPLGALAGLASEGLCALDAGAEPGPAGVLGWPKAAPGDPAWERWGLIVVDVPRRARPDLVRQSRWTIGR